MFSFNKYFSLYIINIYIYIIYYEEQHECMYAKLLQLCPTLILKKNILIDKDTNYKYTVA